MTLFVRAKPAKFPFLLLVVSVFCGGGGGHGYPGHMPDSAGEAAETDLPGSALPRRVPSQPPSVHTGS